MNIPEGLDPPKTPSPYANALTPQERLLNKMRNEIANNLLITASILLLRVEVINFEESSIQLEEAHERIRSIEAVKRQLEPEPNGEGGVAVAGYLTLLCKSITDLMVGKREPITLRVSSGGNSVSSETAVSLGMITTELVMNCIKHAFPNSQTGKILVTYEANKSGWVLSIDDDGIGQSNEKLTGPRGLGTGLVSSLAHQLHAKVSTKSSSLGTSVSIAHIS